MAGVHALMGSKKASALSVNFTDSIAYNYAFTPTDVTTGYQIHSGGQVNPDGATPYTWLLGGLNSDFAVKAEINTGTVTTGTLSTWELLSTSRAWTKTRTLNLAGVAEVILDMQARRVSDSVVIDTWQVAIQAEVV